MSDGKITSPVTPQIKYGIPAVVLKFKRLDDRTTIPRYAHPGEDAAFDLFTMQYHAIAPYAHSTIALGLASEIPQGYFVKIEGKSGLASRHAISILGGVIDSGYRGEWKLVVYNGRPDPFRINGGEAIAQAIMLAVPLVVILDETQLSPSRRGDNGFGSGASA